MAIAMAAGNRETWEQADSALQREERIAENAADLFMGTGKRAGTRNAPMRGHWLAGEWRPDKHCLWDGFRRSIHGIGFSTMVSMASARIARAELPVHRNNTL